MIRKRAGSAALLLALVLVGACGSSPDGKTSPGPADSPGLTAWEQEYLQEMGSDHELAGTLAADLARLIEEPQAWSTTTGIDVHVAYVIELSRLIDKWGYDMIPTGRLSATRCLWVQTLEELQQAAMSLQEPGPSTLSGSASARSHRKQALEQARKVERDLEWVAASVNAVLDQAGSSDPWPWPVSQ